MANIPRKGKAIDDVFTDYQRRISKISCQIDQCDEKVSNKYPSLRDHAREKHAAIIASGITEDSLIQMIQYGNTPTGNVPAESSDDGAASVVQERPDSPPGNESPRPIKRTKSSRARSVSPRRPRPRQRGSGNDPEFRRPGVNPSGRLWTPTDSPASPPRGGSKMQTVKTNPQQQSHVTLSEQLSQEEDAPMTYIKQPETRPISQEQLVAEVKGIYAGLVMVESKCIEVDNAQSSQSDAKLNNEQWQALIALHRTLLHEHHDFFLASQHPSATGALRRLAAKYAMPARMWRHGIHSFLELLRHRLPTSLEHMLTFIYLAYSMMALLYETVPAFEETWIECLGDLGRYRMAIEDDDIRDREIWTSVSRHWYSKASDKSPGTGRLYHHLAILARPNALQQLFYYSKSLCVPTPFASARESIMTLFDPVLKKGAQSRLPDFDAAFVKLHGMFFADRHDEDFESSLEEFRERLLTYLDTTGRHFMQPGYYIAMSNSCALLSYGQPGNPIIRAIRPLQSEEGAGSGETISEAENEAMNAYLQKVLRMVLATHQAVLKRTMDPNILPFAHSAMVFMSHLSRFPEAIAIVENHFPWGLMAKQLNSILVTHPDSKGDLRGGFPGKDTQSARPLPEDYAMRGLLWTDGYFPDKWFSSNAKIDEDEKYFEIASMTEDRKGRLLWLGYKIAEKQKWLFFDEQAQKFSAAPEFDIEDAEPMDLS